MKTRYDEFDADNNQKGAIQVANDQKPEQNYTVESSIVSRKTELIVVGTLRTSFEIMNI